ncbi:MAG: hypothetical protein EA391_07265 [Balneolaceae bacterium]|nr:MAG: hypothetical protein EA391_07265 [Balneolaceae bacterium]
MKFLFSTKLDDLKFVAIQLLLLMTFGLASLGKWRTQNIPESFSDRFGETWMAALPGDLFIPFYSIVLLETVIALLIVVSIVRAEWLANSNKLFLKTGLVLSLFVFVMLGYGLRLTGDFGGAANLFFYFGATLIALFVVENQLKENRTE